MVLENYNKKKKLSKHLKSAREEIERNTVHEERENLRMRSQFVIAKMSQNSLLRFCNSFLNEPQNTFNH